jgi:hypothetical protein
MTQEVSVSRIRNSAKIADLSLWSGAQNEAGANPLSEFAAFDILREPVKFARLHVKSRTFNFFEHVGAAGTALDMRNLMAVRRECPEGLNCGP